MASNVTLDPTTTSGGAVVSTDELSDGTHVQQVKIGTVAAGVYTGIGASNPLPVTGALAVSVGNTVTVTGTVTATPTGTQTVSGNVAISDGGNSITVDNAGTFAVQATQSGTWSVTVGNTVTVTGTVTANAGTGQWSVSDGAVVSKINTVLGNSSLVTSGAIRVNLDSSNVSIGGGTQYSVGTSGVESTGVGNLMLGVRDDALSTLSSGQGQVVPLRVDSTGALWVAAAPGDAETTDGATIHSAGVTRQVNVGFVAEPNTVSVGANTIGMAAMNSQRAIHVSIREDSVGIGGGTQYTEDAAAAANPVGNATILVRADTPAGVTTTNGDNVAQRGTDYGAAYVQIVSSSGSFVDSFGGGTQYSVGTSNVASAGVGTLAMATRDDALSALASGEGQAVGLRVDANGALWVNNVGTAPSSVSDGAVVSALSGTLSVSDGAVVSLLGGTLAVRVVGASSTIISDGGNSITVDAASSFPVSVGNTVTVTGTVTANAGTGQWAVSDGAVVTALSTKSTAANQSTMITALQLIDNPVLAHDTAVGTTQTMMAGARATNSVEGITQVADGDGTRIQADLNGVLLSRNATTLEELSSYHDQTVTTGSIIVSSGFAAGGSGIHNYITSVTVTNTSSTNSYVQLRNGTNGAVVWTLPAPANGGATHNFDPPLKFADNTAVAWDPRVAATTIFISLNGFQAQG